MTASERDRQLVRDLAKRMAEAAALPIQQEKIRLWKRLNSLRPERPMVLLNPQNGWVDLVREQDLRCESPELRDMELNLRQTLFRHEAIHDDYPISSRLGRGLGHRPGRLWRLGDLYLHRGAVRVPLGPAHQDGPRISPSCALAWSASTARPPSATWPCPGTAGRHPGRALTGRQPLSLRPEPPADPVARPGADDAGHVR